MNMLFLFHYFKSFFFYRKTNNSGARFAFKFDRKIPVFQKYVSFIIYGRCIICSYTTISSAYICSK